MLVVALLAGLAAVLLAARWIHEKGQTGGDKVAVASVDIQFGARITPEMIQMVSWPAGNEPVGVFKDPKNLEARVAKTSITRGEVVLEGKLAPQGTKGGLSAVVGEGKRAITVRVNDVIGVAGFALPGNFVDIMVNTMEEGSKSNDKDRSISKIVLEHILVLAVAQEAGRDETKPKVVNAVTLEVTPEQAEKLDLARSVGTLSLVLRNQIDQVALQTSGATKESLLTVYPPKEVAPTAPVIVQPPVKAVVRKPLPSTAPKPVAQASRDCVEIIRGTSRSVECF
ncbi:Flp pilus assembly protein CpaB [Uliginosibacterium sp. 31-16]|uniref:Flp pilus assembly protein CpaB n=1 Tax=Uliginosibacterium sp. 31-16 TaxID=3068315 RepID=UPI00273D882B|nr:Flp pilus assembly protein CpaB [Uliginosibacterium sp. 31-16]MDP5238038.1 Flp pilus assembly protein CpaB [Uliginosibacterium sp. 31-16]